MVIVSEQRNPAGQQDHTRWITQLWDAVRGVRDDVRDLQQAQRTYFEEGAVSAFTAAPFATVTFDSGGDPVLAQLPFGYTPSVGHRVLIGVSQGSCYILGRLA